MSRLKNWAQRKFVNFLVSHLFNAVSANQVLRTKNGKVLIGNQVLNQEMKDRLKLDAQSFRNSLLWNLVGNQVKYLANQRIYEKSSVIEDILAGKMTLYTVKVQEELMDKIEQL